MKRHYVTPNVPFSLGRVGEHHAHEIVFDLRRWKNLYGEGEAQLMARRSGETVMYPVPLTIEGDSAIWCVTKTDNAIAGEDGECELRYLLPDGAVAKSEVWAVSVQSSMSYDQSEPPEEPKPWLDTLNQHIDDVLSMKADLEETAERAGEIAAKIEDVSNDVQTAEDARDAAGESAQQAAGAAENAASSENAAAGSASAAGGAATAAGEFADSAGNSAQQAAQSASDAESSATNAAEAAQQATGAAQRIENMSVEAVTLSPGSAATVEKRTDGDAVRMVFGLPEGLAGVPVKHRWDGTTLTIESASGTSSVDLKGEQGESGITVPLNGFFTLSVDTEGNLWAHSAEDGTPLEFEYNAETGDLYIIQEV